MKQSANIAALDSAVIQWRPSTSVITTKQSTPSMKPVVAKDQNNHVEFVEAIEASACIRRKICITWEEGGCIVLNRLKQSPVAHFKRCW